VKGSQTVYYQCGASSDVPADLSDSFTSDVRRTINGAETVRKASQEEPAYLIEQVEAASN